jgi:hypothetical protein
MQVLCGTSGLMQTYCDVSVIRPSNISLLHLQAHVPDSYTSFVQDLAKYENNLCSRLYVCPKICTAYVVQRGTKIGATSTTKLINSASASDYEGAGRVIGVCLYKENNKLRN